MNWLASLFRGLRWNEEGAIAAAFVLLFPVVVGILALGFEANLWYDIKRHNQAIADVAAYSGALALAAATGSGCTGTASGAAVLSSCASAYNDSNTNGFSFSDSKNTASTVSASDTTVTVTLRHQQAPMLAGYFMGNSPFQIVNQAVATVQSQSSCASSTGGSGRGVVMNGNPTLSMPGCTITSNSTASNSIDLLGGSTVDAWSIYTAGGISDRGRSTLNLTVPETTHGAALKDPYCKSSGNCISVPTSVTGFSAMPTLPSTAAPTTWPTAATTAATRDNTTYPAAPPTQTLSGTCASNSKIDNSSSPNNYNKNCYTASPVTLSMNGTFSSGQYYFAGPVTVTGNITVNSGVDIYVASGDLTISNGGSITIKNNGGKPNGSKADDTVNIAAGDFDATNGTVTFTGDVSATSAYALQVGAGKTARFGSTTFGGAQYAFYGGGVTLGAGNQTTVLGAADYDVATGGVSVASGGIARFSVAGATSATSKITLMTLAGGGTFTNSGTTTFNNSGTSGVSYFINASAYTLSNGSNTTFGKGIGTGLYGGALTVNTGANVSFNTGGNLYLDSGAMTINGCAVVGGTPSGQTTAGTSTIIVNNGNFTGSPTNLTFAPGSSTCGFSFIGADSTYDIATSGSSRVSLGGTSTFNAGTYYFLNSSTSGNGLALTGGTTTFKPGIYSIQNGGFNVSSGATATFNAGTGCTPSGSGTTPGSCLYVANGGISNAGTASFADGGTYYVYAPNGSGTSFSNTGTMTLGGGGSNNFYINNAGGGFQNASSGTLSFGAGNYYLWNNNSAKNASDSGGFSNAGTLTFTGTGSTYSFYNKPPSSGQPGPSGGTGNNSGLCATSSTSYGALSILPSSTTNLSPANYYVVNGDLCIGQKNATAPSLACSSCSPGGAGLTFIMTGSVASGSYANNVSTLQIPDAITATFNAPNGTPSGDHTTCRKWSDSTTGTPNAAGCYAGILFLQDPDYSAGPGTALTPAGTFSGNSCSNNSNCSFLDGGDNMALTGAAYVPSSIIDFKSNNSASTCMVIIAEAIIFSGNSSLNASNCATFGVATVTSTGVALTQ